MPPSRGTPPLTVSCSPACRGFTTSASCWRGGGSRCTPASIPMPVIPTAYQYHRQVFTAFHTLGHPSAKATRRLMKERVVWRCMMRDINNCIGDCQVKGDDPTCHRHPTDGSNDTVFFPHPHGPGGTPVDLEGGVPVQISYFFIFCKI